MRTKPKLLVGLASLTLFDIAVAVAADMPVKAPVRPVPAPVHDWSGFYLGAHAGYRWADATFSSPGYSFDVVDPIAFAAVNQRYRPNGGILGVQAGYNVMLSPTLLAGLEGDWSWGFGKDSLATTFAGASNDGFTFRGSSELKLTWQATIRGRLGIVKGPWLFYGAAGVAFIHAEWTDNATLFTGLTGPINATSSASKTLTGWTVGGGVEYMYTSNWIARVEYLYENFGKFDVPHGFGPQTGTIDLDDVHKLRVAISYKFNRR
jgi:outer membrane immunogenic protein